MDGSAVLLRSVLSKYCLAWSLSPFRLAIRANPYSALPLSRSKSERVFSNADCAFARSPALNAVSASFNNSLEGSATWTGPGFRNLRPRDCLLYRRNLVEGLLKPCLFGLELDITHHVEEALAKTDVTLLVGFERVVEVRRQGQQTRPIERVHRIPWLAPPACDPCVIPARGSATPQP